MTRQLAAINQREGDSFVAYLASTRHCQPKSYRGRDESQTGGDRGVVFETASATEIQDRLQDEMVD